MLVLKCTCSIYSTWEKFGDIDAFQLFAKEGALSFLVKKNSPEKLRGVGRCELLNTVPVTSNKNKNQGTKYY